MALASLGYPKISPYVLRDVGGYHWISKVQKPLDALEFDMGAELISANSHGHGEQSRNLFNAMGIYTVPPST